jgi:hypothetical protein
VLKIVASRTDPFTFVIKHLGKENVDVRFFQKIKRIEGGDAILAITIMFGNGKQYFYLDFIQFYKNNESITKCHIIPILCYYVLLYKIRIIRRHRDDILLF